MCILMPTSFTATSPTMTKPCERAKMVLRICNTISRFEVIGEKLASWFHYPHHISRPQHSSTVLPDHHSVPDHNSGTHFALTFIDHPQLTLTQLTLTLTLTLTRTLTRTSARRTRWASTTATGPPASPPKHCRSSVQRGR